MSEWKPIDTAPKDRIIDVWLGNADEYDVKFYCSEGTRRSVDWAWIEGKFRPFVAAFKSFVGTLNRTGTEGD